MTSSQPLTTGTTTLDSPLLRLDGITKVYYTDEVETHALSGIHLEVKRGGYLAIAGPPGVARPRSFRFSGSSTRPPTAPICSTASPLES
jgi:ABC-type antimicrobial peptide transport system, ATPase component